MLNKLFKILLTIIIIIVFLVFIDKFNKKDITKGSLNLITNYVTGDLTFFQAEYGLYEFEYKYDADYYFAIGYLQAVDRLWQLDYIRRKYNGDLSEILGDKYILQDKFYRCFGIKVYADRLFNTLSKNEKELFINYTNGINYYLTQNENKLSFEFNHLNYKPKPWTPQDILINYIFFIIENDKYKDYDLIGNINKYKRDLELDTTLNKNSKRNTIDLIDSFIENISNNNLFSFYKNDFVNEVKSLIDSNNTNLNNSKRVNLIDTNKKFLSYFKYDKLDFLNNYYPIVSNKENQSSFEFTIIGLPLSIIKLSNILHNKNTLENKKQINQRNINSVVYLKKIIEHFTKDFYSQNNVKFPLNLKKASSSLKGKTLMYVIDTLNIKSKTPIQFYKRNFENAENIISDYSINNQNLIDSVYITFALDSAFFDNAHKILKYYLFLTNQKKNFNLNRNIDLTNIIEHNNEVNETYKNIVNLDVQNFINDELEYNIAQLSNVTIKDIKLLQNISSNEVVNKLLNILKLEGYKWYGQDSKTKIPTQNYELNELYLKLLLYNKNENMLKQDISIQNIKNRYKNSIIYNYLEKNNINNFKNDFLQLMINEMNVDLNLISNDSSFMKKNYYNSFHKINSTKYETRNLYNLRNYFEKYEYILNKNKNITYKDSVLQIFKKVFFKTINKFEQQNIKDLNCRLTILHPLGVEGIFKNSLNFEIVQKGNFGSINHLNNVKNDYFNGLTGHSVRFIYDYSKQDVYYTMYGGTSSNFVNENYNNHLILWSNTGYLKYSLKKFIKSNKNRNYILKISKNN